MQLVEEVPPLNVALLPPSSMQQPHAKMLHSSLLVVPLSVINERTIQ